MRHPTALNVCILIGIAMLVGCSGGPRAIPPWNQSVTLEVVGDWDDIWPALIIAGKSGEVGLLEERPTRVEGDREIREWAFLTVRDQELLARASRRTGEASGVIALTTEGGDEVVARRVLRTWADRLQALAGREFAPR